MSKLKSVDLTDIEFWRDDPYPTLRQLRESSPVYWHEAPPGNVVYQHPFWALTRHEDIVYVSRHPELFSSQPGVRTETLIIGFTDYDTLAMLEADDPYHSRVRGLVSSAFTPKNVQESEPIIRSYVVELLDGLKARAAEEIDFVAEISGALPEFMLGSFLGMPRSDHHLLQEWLVALAEVDDLQINVEAGTAYSPNAAAAAAEMFDYLERLQAVKEKAPANDLVSRLMNAEIEGEKLTWRQQRECFFILVGGGLDTTRNTATAAAQALFDNPAQRADLAADVDLLGPAIEEMLRWASPVIYFRRTATQDTQIGDQQIREGDWVVMYYGAANRDPAVFTNPESFDIRRSPNKHVAFGGGGPHFCMGAPLARLELRVLFEELLKRYPNYAVTGDLPYMYSNFFRGIQRMPVVLEPR